MDLNKIRNFRESLRILERELSIQNNSSCCCGVTLTQCHTLMELSKEDNITLNELSEKLSLDKSTTSRIVESLVKNGLLNRTIPEDNRRTTNISLTNQGKQVCDEIHNGNDDYYTRVLNSIPEDEVAIFLKSFNTLVNKMNEINRSNIKCGT